MSITPNGGWQSNALWPSGVCPGPYGNNISSDTHQTRDTAMGVCRGLHLDGFGGEKKVFPIATWASEVQECPRIPRSVSLLLNFWSEHNVLQRIGRSGPGMFYELDWWIMENITIPDDPSEVVQVPSVSFLHTPRDYMIGAGLPDIDTLRYITSGRWPRGKGIDQSLGLPCRSFFGAFTSFLSDLRVSANAGVRLENAVSRQRDVAARVKEEHRAEGYLETLLSSILSLPPATSGQRKIDDVFRALKNMSDAVGAAQQRAKHADARADLWEWAAETHKEMLLQIISEKPPAEWIDSLRRLKEAVTGDAAWPVSVHSKVHDLELSLAHIVREVEARDFSCMSQRCKVVPGVSCCKDSLNTAVYLAKSLLNP